mmetsp:Transcript_560/g.1497  ORF Transcript_560/g.1497 Transcript_560/m.1497 type:complete len:260 (+) Transcript_560:2492-3271(+)
MNATGTKLRWPCMERHWDSRTPADDAKSRWIEPCTSRLTSSSANTRSITRSLSTRLTYVAAHLTMDDPIASSNDCRRPSSKEATGINALPSSPSDTVTLSSIRRSSKRPEPFSLTKNNICVSKTGLASVHLVSVLEVAPSTVAITYGSAFNASNEKGFHHGFSGSEMLADAISTLTTPSNDDSTNNGSRYETRVPFGVTLLRCTSSPSRPSYASKAHPATRIAVAQSRPARSSARLAPGMKPTRTAFRFPHPKRVPARV